MNILESAAHRLGVSETPVRGFSSVLEAKKVTKAALGEHEAVEPLQRPISGLENASRKCR